MRKQPRSQKGQNRVKHDDTCVEVNSRAVNISKLKDFVARNLPPGSPLQVVFVGENDVLSAEAFLAKLPIWLRLSKFKSC